MRILLFDIDGVLVKPFGYRKAYFETCKWIIGQGNLQINLPAEDIPALFESFGVTSEWDMLSITASIMLDSVLEENQISLESDKLEQALLELASIEKNWIEIDFRQHIQSISSTYNSHEIPSIGLLKSGRKYLTNIPDKILKDMLEDTRSAHNTLITRVFQNLVLGTKTFQETYQLEPLIDCNSYLRTFDSPLLSAQIKDLLDQQKKSGEVLFAALTARPSLQPRDAKTIGSVNFSPEAELALDVIGMPDMPLIGYGRLQYIEQFVDMNADLLIKPDPFHALAAIFSLLANSESSGLEAAIETQKTKKLPQWVHDKIDNPLSICVFEDSQGGIRSVISAAKLLQQLGINTSTKLYGITNNKDKKQTLENLDAVIFPDINDALKCEFNL